jgi:hypothetical protein
MNMETPRPRAIEQFVRGTSSVVPTPSPQSGEGSDLSRNARPEKSPLTAHSRGRGNWDCVRQMQMYRRRPDVLAAALRDLGFSESGDEVTDDQYSDN